MEGGEEKGAQKGAEGCGCDVGERLRDYRTLVYFVDIAAPPFLLCHSPPLSLSLSLSLSFPPRAVLPLPRGPGWRAIKALSTVTA